MMLTEPNARLPISIVEVGPRDGLQNEPTLLATSTKVEMINRLWACGFDRMEIASFVNPARVPQMADAEAVVSQIVPRPSRTRIGLVLNTRGAQRALATGVDELGAVAIASDGFGIANQGQTSAQSVVVAGEILALAHAAGRSAQVTISTAFGCPFDGEVDPARVIDIVGELASFGPREIALADTIGVGVPRQVLALVAGAVRAAGPIPIRAHFHDTRNTGLANALAAFEAGASVLDASVGGLGGCPFAPGASGNIATEDLVYALERSGLATGIDLDALIATARWLAADVFARTLPGAVSRAGRFPPSQSPVSTER